MTLITSALPICSCGVRWVEEIHYVNDLAGASRSFASSYEPACSCKQDAEDTARLEALDPDYFEMEAA